MFSFIHIVDPQSPFNRLPWLLSHNRSSTGAGLLRWVARAIFCMGRSSRVGWVVLVINEPGAERVPNKVSDPPDKRVP